MIKLAASIMPDDSDPFRVHVVDGLITDCAWYFNRVFFFAQIVNDRPCSTLGGKFVPRGPVDKLLLYIETHKVQNPPSPSRPQAQQPPSVIQV